MKLQIINYNKFFFEDATITEDIYQQLEEIFKDTKFKLSKSLQDDIAEYYEVITMNEFASRLPKQKHDLSKVIPASQIEKDAVEKSVIWKSSIVGIFDYDPQFPNQPVIICDYTEDAEYDVWIEFKSDNLKDDLLLLLDLDDFFCLVKVGEELTLGCMFDWEA